jgi:hypothetical protein
MNGLSHRNQRGSVSLSDADRIIHGISRGTDIRQGAKVPANSVVDLFDVSKSSAEKGRSRRKRILEDGQRQIPQFDGSFAPTGAGGKGFSAMSDFFKNLFHKKTEQSMQKRAEKSRKQETEELDEKFNEARDNLYSLLDELHKKKSNNGS